MTNVAAVAVVAAGGFLAESAPLARLHLSPVMRRAGETNGARHGLLLSHEQRRAFEDGAIGEHVMIRLLPSVAVRCYRTNEEGKVVPERWTNGCNAWVDLGDMDAMQQQIGIDSVDRSLRCVLVWALVAEALREVKMLGKGR